MIINKRKIFYLLTSILLMANLFSCGKTTMKIRYSGKDLTKDVTILRKRETKEASLKVVNQKDWQLFAGTSVDNINTTTPILTGSDEGEFIIDVSSDMRSYFLFSSSQGTAIMAETLLPMSGGYNFRDLGGFRTVDNRYTKWGKIFRSDDLNHLTDADLEYLASIPLVSIVDFRSQDEIDKAPDKNPSSVLKNYQMSISPGNILALEEIAKKGEKEMKQLMMNLNINLVSDAACISNYKEFFALLQSDENMPLMFHCSAGKDRTGMAGALILYSLGVDEEAIMADYLSSNDYLGDKYTQLKEEYPNMSPLVEVRTEYLQAGLNKIKEEHGSIDNFLKNSLNVDIQKMREKYLY